LIENQVLVSELELNVLGNDVLAELISTLKKYSHIDGVLSKLTLLQTQTEHLDAKIGNDQTVYEAIIDTIKEIDISFDPKYLFQTNLSIESHKSELDIKHAYTIKKIIPFLLKLNSYKKNENLERFKKAFLDRYEGQEIPLSIALDIESGLGYIQNNSTADTTPFLQDITPSNKKNKDNSATYSLEKSPSIILQKLIDANASNDYVIEITDKDFETIELQWENLPDTLAAFVKIVTVDNKEQLIVNGLGNGAGKLLARFCDSDKNTKKHVEHIAQIEQSLNPNKILAEIAHLPEARTGNILKRSHIREYEIPYIAKSTLPKSKQLLINDLYLSVKNDSIILKSKRLNKEVLPRLTNAHNYSPNALPIYHFLCDLESQNTRNYLGFSWIKIAPLFTFLPRVIYKDVILSEAKWNIFKKTIQKFMIYDNDELLLETINTWRKSYNVPDYVQIVENDNTLLIYMKHIESIKLFRDSIKGKKKVQIKEFLDTNNRFKRGVEQFSNECIITFYNNQKLNSLD